MIKVWEKATQKIVKGSTTDTKDAEIYLLFHETCYVHGLVIEKYKMDYTATVHKW